MTGIRKFLALVFSLRNYVQVNSSDRRLSFFLIYPPSHFISVTELRTMNGKQSAWQKIRVAWVFR